MHSFALYPSARPESCDRTDRVRVIDVVVFFLLNGLLRRVATGDGLVIALDGRPVAAVPAGE